MTGPAAAARPTVAGMYDYYLGGTAGTAADRAAAERLVRAIPALPQGAWANRGFLQRAVKRMAAEWGIRQFIDIGAGLPTQRNTHDVVAEVRPDGRVVYVDIDPVVVSRGNEIVADVPAAAVIQGDVRDVKTILSHPRTQALIDFSSPVGLLMVAVMHFVPDRDDPWTLVARYLDALPSGSYLALSHGSGEHSTDSQREALAKIYASTAMPPTDRTRAEIERFFHGLVMLPPYPGSAPGLDFAGVWGAEDPDLAMDDGVRGFYAAVARKP
jgi:S-adenosyl methyltransferase